MAKSGASSFAPANMQYKDHKNEKTAQAAASSLERAPRPARVPPGLQPTQLQLKLTVSKKDTKRLGKSSILGGPATVR